MPVLISASQRKVMLQYKSSAAYKRKQAAQANKLGCSCSSCSMQDVVDILTGVGIAVAVSLAVVNVILYAANAAL